MSEQRVRAALLSPRMAGYQQHLLPPHQRGVRIYPLDYIARSRASSEGVEPVSRRRCPQSAHDQVGASGAWRLSCCRHRIVWPRASDSSQSHIGDSMVAADSIRVRNCPTADGVNGGIVFVVMIQSDGAGTGSGL